MTDEVKEVTEKEVEQQLPQYDVRTRKRKGPRKPVLRVPMTDDLLAAITTAADADDREPENMAMRVLRDHFIR